MGDDTYEARLLYYDGSEWQVVGEVAELHADVFEDVGTSATAASTKLEEFCETIELRLPWYARNVFGVLEGYRVGILKRNGKSHRGYRWR